ncbi:MAG: NAD(P)/FAD-dependent oxidoreductase [Bacillota bacterium]|nr:NAD(P)/FAD-dependent oxidoreductase [Bacillota bacterium]
MNKPVIVVGAGASGLICAGFLARKGAQVIVIEKKERSACKLRITGKGRCNITNAMPTAELFRNYPGNGRFLYGALHRFSNEDCMEFFRNLGVELKVERGSRVFPVSDDAHEIANALEKFACDNGAKLLFNHTAKDLIFTKDGHLDGVLCATKDKESVLDAQSVIIATGGKSYPGTGSTGDGYRMANRVGHSITKLRPALVPVKVKEVWAKELSGLTLKNVELSVKHPKEGQLTYFGEFMFTHFGLTGPIILTASEQVGLWLEQTGRPLKAFINLKPALSEEQLDKRLLRDFERHSKKQFANSLEELLPKSLIDPIVQLSKIPPSKPVNQISKSEREGLRRLLQRLPLTITGTLPLAAAIVTAGGVNVKEINPKTMESKLIKGLYFIGEVVDVHGVTGGFNLQAAFSMGYCAAENIVF